jgi:hypothetical protein
VICIFRPHNFSKPATLLGQGSSNAFSTRRKIFGQRQPSHQQPLPLCCAALNKHSISPRDLPPRRGDCPSW